MNIGELVKTLRRRANLTQKNVADALGVTQQAVSAVEAGISDMSAMQLAAVAKLAGHEIVIRPITTSSLVLAEDSET